MIGVGGCPWSRICESSAWTRGSASSAWRRWLEPASNPSTSMKTTMSSRIFPPWSCWRITFRSRWTHRGRNGAPAQIRAGQGRILPRPELSPVVKGWEEEHPAGSEKLSETKINSPQDCFLVVRPALFLEEKLRDCRACGQRKKFKTTAWTAGISML